MLKVKFYETNLTIFNDMGNINVISFSLFKNDDGKYWPYPLH